ncbi:MAG TPA: hypothetical protein VK447_10465, partial [Myxococcaceae bacterium]|nr:hypothetical protein [Myxococcaceae bacterium]
LEAVFYDVVVDAAGKEDHGQLEDLLRDLVRRSTQRPSSVPKGDDVPVTTGVGMPHPRIVHPLLRATEFQPRPLYQQPLEEFIQRTPGGGVLALAGIGGSGKTALVREALAAVLSGSLDSKLDGVFVWSFYDEPDAAAFLRSVAGYVSGLDASADCTEVRALDLIRRHCAPTTRLLLVLDGLEKLQLERPDDRNVHGALESPTIRRLLLWLAQSTVAARAVVTTRFPLRDLEGEQRSDRVRFLDLDSLTRPQSRALLRQRGVNGEERELDVLLDHFGAHALTVDHLGGVISTYLDGNPTRYPELGDGPLTRFEAGESGKRLARVLAAYQGYLERDEPAVRAALEAFVIFPRPAGIRTVADVFLNPERSSRAGALQGKSELDLIACVRRLVELRFLRPEPLRGEVVYSIHPALRDAVLSAMGDKRIVLASVAQESVEASVARLEGRPGSPPSDPSARDLIEDLIGFCLDASHEARAYELYQQRLGGYPELGWKLGDYRRGERLARRLLEHGDQLEGMTQKRARLAVDLAMALETLGRMPEALAVYQGVLTDIGQRLPNETRSVWMVTRSHALARLLAGQLKTATAVAEQSVMVAENSRSDWWKRDSFCTRGEIRAARGFIAQAFGDFATAFSRQLMREDRPNPPYGLGGFHLQITLMRVNRVAEALVLARASLPLNEQSSWLDSVLRSRLAEVEALRRLGELDDALVNWNRVRHDVMETDYMELVAWSHLFGARLLHERADREAAWREAEEGLRTAETCGFGLLAIDFRNQLGQMLLDAGNAASAARFASEALARARHEECGYFWGQLQAHDTLALLRGNGSEATEASEHERQALAMRKQVAVTDDMVRPLLPTSWRELVGAFAKNYARFQRRAQQGEARSNLMAIRTAFRSIYQER